MIDAPPEAVWRVVMDPSRLHEWVSIHHSVDDVPPGPAAEGSSFVQRLGLGGRTIAVRWTVCDVEEPRCAVWDGAGPAGSRARIEYELRPHGRGTRFRYANRFRLPGGLLGRIASRLVSNRLARREARRSISRLKGLLEPG
jgi:carbon monoxide dehydrogenase subunit G